MASEVCSIYLLRDQSLELFATHGLRKEAVHVTRLALGEGLVGTIAEEGRMLNLAEAASHPEFVYRPETGEERFHSFAGVPIVRRESAIGVLAVQHAEPRRYEEVEIEALQTVAMVLSEMIGSARLVDGSRGRMRDGGTQRLAGLKLVAGMAKGIAVFHQPRVIVEHTVAEDTEAERARVYAAFRRMREQIDNMTREAEFGTAGEHKEILETYKMFAYDEGWSRRINEAIDSGLTAEAAIERVQQRTRARMREIDDPLLKERMHDLEDLSNRLMRIVSGRMGTAAQTGLNKDAILIARNLGPAELLEYDKRRLEGRGARGRLADRAHDDRRPRDGRAGGRPRRRHPPHRQRGRRHPGRRRHGRDRGAPDAARWSPASSSAWRPASAAAPNSPRCARCRRKRSTAQPIALMVNAGLAEDAVGLDANGAEGIGLFRTEFQFLISATLPGRESQQRLYRSVLDAAGDRPVVFRTVDIGGDKALPYLSDEKDEAENPAMGWRALRLSLSRSALMKAQARALIEASDGRVLRVMFPMISEPWEYEEARSLFEEQLEWSRRPTAARCRRGSNSARCSKCRRWPKCSTCCCRGSISCRSGPTI